MKALIVDDDEGLQRLWAAQLGGKVQLLQAQTIEDARVLFDINRDVDVVVMDGCVPGRTLNTVPLVKYIRQNSVTIPIIASASNPNDQEELISAGCDYRCEKRHVPEKIIEVLRI